MKNQSNYNSLLSASLNVSDVCASIMANGIDYLDPVSQKTNRQLLTEDCAMVLSQIGFLVEDKELNRNALCIEELKAWNTK